jgi:hypothetical protein
VETSIFFIQYFLYIGYTTTKAIAVVQFGFAISFAFQIFSAFICGIIKGTSFLYLKAEELSMTVIQYLFAIGI